ncbi:MAG: hypothetical protein RSC93_04345 [Erysipelotrichaceae bacterium]
MKGYKATDENMRCRGFQYEIGKTYRIKGELEFDRNGFHFCKRLIAIEYYYDLLASRVFEVEAIGEVKSDGLSASDELNLCTDEIRFVRELSKEEIIELANESVDDVNVYHRIRLAASKLASKETLKILSEDAMWCVRETAAGNLNLGTELLNILSKDESCYVRFRVAENPHTSNEVLNMLSKDEASCVRAAVAENVSANNKILNYLRIHGTVYIRCLVAENSNTNEDLILKLSKDVSARVRKAIGENPKTSEEILKKLRNDSNYKVRDIAIKALNRKIFEKINNENSD